MRKYYIIIPVAALLTAISLRIFTDIDSDYTGLLLFPLFLFFSYYKDTLKRSIYRSIFSIIIVFSFWGHFTVKSLVFSFTGALLLFGALFLLKKLIPCYLPDTTQEKRTE